MVELFSDGERILGLLKQGLSDGVYPGAVLLVSKDGQIIFFQEIGHLSVIPKKAPMKKNTIFDLASLTKPLATTLAMMNLVEQGKIGLDQSISEIVRSVLPEEKKTITPRLLLCHSAGFPDWKPYYLDLIGYRLVDRKQALRQWIIKEPFAYPPGEGCVYSDLGFMVLEWLIEEAAGMPMAQFVERNLYEPLERKRPFFITESHPSRYTKEDFAATEDCSWRKRVLQGEVHDENAYAAGGYSGHAGLFGDAEDVYAIVTLLREHFLGKRGDYLEPQTARAFLTRQDIVDGSTWALGWDTPSTENSSSGKYFSSVSFGHLGFTGTSIWMDFEKDVMMIFLTNRVHPSRKNEKIKRFRPKLHNLVMEELGEDK